MGPLGVQNPGGGGPVDRPDRRRDVPDVAVGRPGPGADRKSPVPGVEHGWQAPRLARPASRPSSGRRPRRRARHPEGPPHRVPGRAEPAGRRANALPPRPAPGRRTGVVPRGGSTRRAAAVAPVRRDPPDLGVLGLDRHPQRGGLRSSADQTTGDSHRLPRTYRRASAAHARQGRRTGDPVGSGPREVGVHGPGPGLGSQRPAGPHRMRRWRTRWRARAFPLGQPEDPHRRPGPRVVGAAPRRRGPAVPARGLRVGRAPRHPREPRHRPAGPHLHRRSAPLVLVPAQQQPGQRHRPISVRAGRHPVLRPPGQRMRLDRRTRRRRTARGTACTGVDPDHRPGGRSSADFPAAYPWAGNKGQVFSQVGNAVPPRLAGHLLAPHIGKHLDPDDFTLAA